MRPARVDVESTVAAFEAMSPSMDPPLARLCWRIKLRRRLTCASFSASSSWWSWAKAAASAGAGRGRR